MSGRIENGIERVFDIGGSERATVVEMDASTEMKNVSERVGSAPGIGKIAMEIHLVVAFEKAAEEKPVNLLRLGVGREAWIEIGGVGFD